ncbi:MAG: formyltransferase family protein [bacterium]|nr:formyltransferase family protein [bacterium]
MRVLLLTNGQANQKALASRIQKVATLSGIIVSNNIPKRRPAFWKTLRLRANALASRSVGRPLLNAWLGMLDYYQSAYPDFPIGPIQVSNVNDDATMNAIDCEKPDLVVVSGTNLVGKRVIEASMRSGRIINLHTGISPYVRGGPNCTNWCLSKGWFDLIGNTIMWLDLGIDTGNIIATEQTPLDGSETLELLHTKVMDHAHSLYVRVIERIGEGSPVRSVRQSNIGVGTHFNSVDWSLPDIRRAVNNFQSDYSKFFNDQTNKLNHEIRYTLVPLEHA